MAEHKGDWLPRDVYRKCMEHFPYPCANVAVFHTDKVLLLRRATEPAKGLWTLPGGGINRGETPLEAAIRELEEETGLGYRKDWYELVGWAYYDHGERVDVAFSFRVRIPHRMVQPQVMLSDEHTAHDWVRARFARPEILVPGMENEIRQAWRA